MASAASGNATVTLAGPPTHHAITGASSGLGAALARACAGPSHVLTLFGRDDARLDTVADDCVRLGASVAKVRCDITDAPAMREALVDADRRCPVDIVIANAAIGGADVLSSAAEEPYDLARRIFETNLLGTINTITPLQSRFVERRRGRFVVIGSMAAFEGLADAPAYAASKAAVRTYGHGLRRRLAAYDVHVTIVSPGFITTPMSNSLPFEHAFPWTAERSARHILRGIERGAAEIAFPWQLRLGLAIGGVLPLALVDAVLERARSRLRRDR